MCKDPKKVKKTVNIFKFIAFLGFGLFGITGAGFYLDYMATQRHRCHEEQSHFNERQTPDCYSHHFFGTGWLMMAAVVPFFGIFGECKPKVTIIGAILAFLAGIFGLYFVIMIFVDDRPYDFRKDRQPKQQFGHGFILMGEGVRSGFELLQIYLESFLPKKDKHVKQETNNNYQQKHEKSFQLVQMRVSHNKA